MLCSVLLHRAPYSSIDRLGACTGTIFCARAWTDCMLYVSHNRHIFHSPFAKKSSGLSHSGGRGRAVPVLSHRCAVSKQGASACRSPLCSMHEQADPMPPSSHNLSLNFLPNAPRRATVERSPCSVCMSPVCTRTQISHVVCEGVGKPHSPQSTRAVRASTLACKNGRPPPS